MKRIFRTIKVMLLTGAMLAAAASLCFAATPELLAPFKAQSGTLDIAGGTAHIPVMKAAAQSIMKYNPKIRITVAGGGSGVGVQQVGEGLVQIGNTGRPLKDSEIKKYGLKTFPFAIDGVAIVVNPSNKVEKLSKDQLKKIFAGEITNWKEVGGSNARITVYIREDGSGTRETFEERALDKGKSASKSNVVNSNGAMKTAVAQDKNSIGYVGIGHLDAKLKGIVLDGMVPSQENAKKGTYKVTRLLYMNTKGEPKGLAREFINYIYSKDGHEYIAKSGYIPLDAPKK